MKILSLDIASFGKFKNFHLDFPDNLTVVFGENENGKSTIMAFIRMMFYGNTGKTSDIHKNPRIKYRPWDTDFMAGSINFSHNEKNYRLEREFKKSNSTDKITLIDLDTGVSTSLSGSDDIGAKFFGLTDAAFERSVFLSESIPSSANDAANGEINSRLSNATATGNDEVSFELICSRLSKAKEALFSRSGKKGACDKAIAEKEALALEIRQAEETEERLDALRKEISEKEEEYQKHSADTVKLFELLKSADKIKKKAIIEKYLDAVNERDKLQAKLRLKDGNIADNDFTALGRGHLANYNAYIADLSDLTKDAEALKAEIAKLSEVNTTDSSAFDEKKAQLNKEQSSLEGDIDSARREISAINQKIEELTPTKKINPVFFIIGALIMIVGGVVSGFVHTFIGAGIIAIGFIAAISGFFIKKTVAPDDSELKNQLSRISVKLSALVDEKESVAEKLAALEKQNRDIQVKALADKAILEEKGRQLENLASEKEAVALLIKENERLVLSHISLFTDSFDISSAGSVLDLIDADIRALETATQRVNLLADHGSIISAEQAKARLAAIVKDGLPEDLSEEDLELAKERFKTKSDQNGKMRSEISALKVQLKALADSTPSVALLRLKDEDLAQKIEGYTNFGAKTELVQEVLDEAFRELRKSYSGALETRTAEVFALITDNKYSSVNVSKNFELGVTSADVFGLKNSQYLSVGAEDQLYLALRLALAELMTEQTGVLPLLMDDPLSQYDDKRMIQTTRFLSDYAKERQLILFTCHNTVVDAAKNSGANIITL